ncbi:homocysteine-responsive endoplasmic reticulum-resident ubiquitin-like domain member 2 protein [Topomyia yanbarensis]|uniref:homocysteine-responsive endoplasmic reticulum-resident ubiquitin-like domain member 2 protein n=1 Tax=Topomyia yanbarensis TaxID=2498891 RepID=UPI00273C5C38|nr:homocysteine-responsive endoplasmic reticulum-resident ubiquitin-like domain member 2 protein [Topomyia yanbarensis]
MDITLIVKATNQQFDDQTIKCEPTWSIRRLKGHLTEVHPGKPSADEQKLIYSGQLLSDSVILKDVLRHYDGQQAYTVHLVFTPKNNRHQKESGSFSGCSASSIINNNSKNMSPKAPTEAGSASTSSNARRSNESSAVPENGPSSSIGADGLRQRILVSEPISSAAGSTSIPSSSMSPNTADYIMGQHLAMQNWMQQTYMQYLNQYMHVISNGQTNPQTLYTSTLTNPPATISPQPNPQMTPVLPIPPVNANPILAQTLPNLAYYPYLSTVNSSPMPSASSIPAPITSSGTIPTSPAQPSVSPSSSSQTPALPSAVRTSIPSHPVAGQSTEGSATSTAPSAPGSTTVDGTAEAQPAAAAGAGQAAAAAGAAPAPARRFPNIVVEEQENRDWLDIFFSMCRVGILMTVVYLYSSPTRCLTVFFIGISLYLYQIGFFRNNNNNTDRLERARQIVVQQINNAHGIRPNADARPRVPGAAVAAAPVAPDANTAANGQTAQVPSPSDETVDKPKVALSEQDANTAVGSSTEAAVEPGNKPASPVSVPQMEDSVEQNPVEAEDPSNVVQEANRINLNDVAAFLRTLVLSFFTSIIPDTPAA